MEVLPESLSALKSYSQFIIHYNKIPRDALSGKYNIDPHNPANWMACNVAIDTAKRLGEGYGVGFVLTASDSFWCLDIDHAWDGMAWSSLSLELYNRLAGCAFEVSQSRTGMHIFGSGKVPEHGCKKSTLGIELYTEKRFIALTGINACGDITIDATVAIAAIVSEYFPVNPISQTSQLIEPTIEMPDDEVISRMLNAKPSASVIWGNGVSPRDLWEANAEVLEKRWPHGTERYDASSADAALATIIAFWTRDTIQIERIMRRSGLYREKYDVRDDYLPRTIGTACGIQKKQYSKKDKIKDNTTCSESQAPASTESIYLTLEQQKIMLGNCLYIIDEHKIADPTEKDPLDEKRFRAKYGQYMWSMDEINIKQEKNAWKSFLQSGLYPNQKVTSSCFRPDLPTSQIIETDDKVILGNIYQKLDIKRIKGDITPFLVHLNKLFPVAGDYEIVLSYLAALVQYQGVKFQYCLAIQGCQGNGKTFLTQAMEYCIGERYSHRLRAAGILDRFNGWLTGKILVTIDEICCSERQRDVMDGLKELITGEKQEIERKGLDKVKQTICANFLINTNYKDALKITEDSRRYALFITPQQSLQDRIDQGMMQPYFDSLIKNWFHSQQGKAIILDYLLNYDIPNNINPALGGNAPHTSSRAQAVTLGLDKVEQHIIELIGQSVDGFRNNWISLTWFNNHLDNFKKGSYFSDSEKKKFLESLGYVPHPGLREGRTDNAVSFDGHKKSRLYIKKDHPHYSLMGSSRIVKAYEDDQKP